MKLKRNGGYFEKSDRIFQLSDGNDTYYRFYPGEAVVMMNYYFRKFSGLKSIMTNSPFFR